MARPPKFFAVEEWYHCYSRGIDKRTVFKDASGYKRFVELLFLANSRKTLHRSDITHTDHRALFSLDRDEPLVSIGAYALMPNHFHLLIKETREAGISSFMRKLGTAYTMYFNIKYERSGGLFTRPFRARHIADDRYFQHVVSYIHLNPAELFERGWKEG